MTTRMQGFRLHGLDVISDVGLHRPAAVLGCDVAVTADERRRVALDRPSGETIVLVSHGDTPVQTGVQRPDGSRLLRLHRYCDIDLSPDAADVRMHLDPSVESEALPVLANGTAFAFVLEALGHTVLHASAIQVGDAAVGFLGHRGRGKSTVAALSCAAGASLVTDDVLRVDTAGSIGGTRCWAGATEIRLRPQALPIMDLFPAPPFARTTFDGRMAISPPPCTQEELPLAGLVLPVPDRSATSVGVRPVPPGDAVLELSRALRIEGWVRPCDRARHFRDIVALARQVPVHVVEIPWGWFDAGGASELLDRLDEAVVRRALTAV